MWRRASGVLQTVGANGDGGAFGEQDADGGLMVEEGEGGAVEGGEVGGDGVGGDGVDVPAGVLDLVDGGAAVAAPGVAPVVLSDELFFAGRCNGLGLRGCGGGESVPAAGELPGVAGGECVGGG
jgi:hypothetical protein